MDKKRAPCPFLVNDSNLFIDMSVIYQINYQLFFFKPFHSGTNIVVERVPYIASTLNSLALTMLMVSHYWLIENQILFTNESRNAMVLAYDF